MSFDSDSFGFGRRVTLVLSVSTVLALGCSGKSESGDDDDGMGGASGGSSGGTSGSGGTAGTSPTGGTGSNAADCISVCQRGRACPDAEPLDCGVECAMLADEAAGYVCMPEFERYFACVASLDDVCSFDPNIQCVNEVGALLGCYSADPATARCSEDVPAMNTTCDAICARTEACPNAAPNCVASCSDNVADAAANGCAAEHQRYSDCVGSCRNICAITVDDCRSSFDAYIDCKGG